jgi:hypothetical protein
MLDCNTPKGQEALVRQHEAGRLFERRFPTLRVFHTPDESGADIDMMVVEGGRLRAVAEVKARDMTFAQFSGPFNREWLITEDKLKRGQSIASALCVPFIGVLYLWREQMIFVHKFTGGSWRVERTATQATVNGGTAVRANAYVKVTDAGWRAPEAQTNEGWLRDYEGGG